jgi:hypothetical protein
VYEPPKLKSDAGHRTLSVPVFFIPDKGEIGLSRQCMDFSWFTWCAVFAFPTSTKIVFTPIENTNETRGLILQIVENLPDSIEFGLCNGTDARTANKQGFLNYLAGITGTSCSPCEVSLPEYCRLVTIGARSDLAWNEIAINHSSRLVYENASGTVESRPYKEVMDIVFFITGGAKALDYEQESFSQQLASATRIMLERTVLVSQRLKEYNRQPCLECSTPFPQACGWTDYRGTAHESEIYHNFISMLGVLKTAISSGNYNRVLLDTALKYDELKNEGCE